MNTTTAQITITTTTQPKTQPYNRIKRFMVYNFCRLRIVEKVRGFTV